MHASALVLFSGGQDSTTCLAWALTRYRQVHTVGFSYGQRHQAELSARQDVRRELCSHFPAWADRLGEDHVLDIPILGEISQTALTQARAIEFQSNGLPNTFVPGRNLLFFSLAAALAYRLGAWDLVGGMCETDFSGYPDCRHDTLQAMEKTLVLGVDPRFVLHTPLMWLSKAQTWQLAKDLGGPRFVQVIQEHTHTCYLGDHHTRHAHGYGCGQCPACQLRERGFEAFLKLAQAEPSAL
jgi:7-cyano-7-deazaguanine synthase